MSSSNANNASLLYVDLSTQISEDSLAVFGGADAVNIFVSVFRKVINHSPIPIAHRLYSGTANFNNSVEFSITRVGDYVTHSWLRVVFPAISTGGTGTCRWTDDLMQSLISHLSFTFTDLEVYKFDHHFINFWANHTVPESKWNAYQRMIGNNGALNVLAGTQAQTALQVPLPMFYARRSDDGANAALPVASVPFNELRCKIDFRNYSDLIEYGGGATSANLSPATPTLVRVEMWSNYVIVPVEHRVVMSKIERDYWIEQVQTSYTTFTTTAGTTNSHDVRHPYIVKYFAFAVQNQATATRFTDYTSALIKASGSDTIDTASLLYDNTARLSSMPVDYFAFTEAFYKWPAVSRDVGWYSYSYAHDPFSVKHTGGTNLSVLANTTWQLTPSTAITATAPSSRVVMMTINSQVIKIRKGSGGFLS